MFKAVIAWLTIKKVLLTLGILGGLTVIAVVVAAVFFIKTICGDPDDAWDSAGQE